MLNIQKTKAATTVTIIYPLHLLHHHFLPVQDYTYPRLLPPPFQPSYFIFDSSFQRPLPPPRSDIAFSDFHIPAQLSSANFNNKDRGLSGNLFGSQTATLTREKEKEKVVQDNV